MLPAPQVLNFLVGLLTVTQPPAVGHPGRQGRPLQGPAPVLSRAVRRGLG